VRRTAESPMPSPSVLTFNSKTVLHDVGRRFVNLDSLPWTRSPPTLPICIEQEKVTQASCVYGVHQLRK
jgi:hypothetical protein